MRRKLKCGGKPRKKALFGIDGAAMAAATIAAAGMNVAATAAAAKQQANAMIQNAKTQGQAIMDQTRASNEMTREQIATQRQINKENQNSLQDINISLQMAAGRQNANERLEANKKQLKMGGRGNRKLERQQPLYGGASFTITDGGYAQPVAVYDDGVLYELKGNDHEHYHKTSRGKSKSGVGVKTYTGEIIEGEGDQNTGRGELVFFFFYDLQFISKHSIKRFNPREAVLAGIHPTEAFNIQENIKDIYGIPDDGNKAKCGKRAKCKCGSRKSIKKPYGGLSISTVPIINPQADFYKANASYFANGNKVPTLSGGNSSNFFNNYGGAIMNSGANLIGTGLNWIGNAIGQRRLANARNKAAGIMTKYANEMTGISMDELNAEDYASVDAMAAIRDANTNINPQLERIRRNAAYERNEVNRNTLSSAARQQRIAAINDRMAQRMSEQYAYKHNANEQILQGNAERLTQVASQNADRRAQARQNYSRDRMNLLMYNNNIENQKRSIVAQAQSDALVQNASDYSTMMQIGFGGMGQAIAAGGNAFGQVFDSNRVYNQNLDMVMFGADTANKVDYAIQQASRGNKELAREYYISFVNSNNPEARKYANRLRSVIA